MISAKNAIVTARSMLGTPYGKGPGQVDCINYIRTIIRIAPGGVPGYNTAGTNTLWKSYEAAPKYRDLTWRQEGLQGAKAGMLAFKRDGADVHHVGLVTGTGTVLHSSSAMGKVVETDLNNGQWSLLAVHRYIAVDESIKEGDVGMTALYQAEVVTSSGPLNIREAPSTTARVLGQVPKGATLDVLVQGEWPRVHYNGTVGYVSGVYLRRVEDAPVVTTPTTNVQTGTITIIDDDGNVFRPSGNWRVLIGAVD